MTVIVALNSATSLASYAREMERRKLIYHVGELDPAMQCHAKQALVDIISFCSGAKRDGDVRLKGQQREEAAGSASHLAPRPIRRPHERQQRDERSVLWEPARVDEARPEGVRCRYGLVSRGFRAKHTAPQPDTARWTCLSTRRNDLR